MSGQPFETAPASRTLLHPLAGRGEGKLRVVEKPVVLAWIAEPLGEGSSRERLSVLVDAGRLQAATALLAYALPEREAVWWACLGVEWAMPALPAEDRRALAAAEAWVRHPGDATRHACLEAGKRVGRKAPAAAVAFGAHAARLDRPTASLAGRWVHTALDGVLAAAGNERGRVSCRVIESACDIAAGGAGRFRSAAPRAGAA